MNSAEDIKRFRTHIKKTKGCWEWQLRKDKDGYGIFTIKSKSKKAHRISYEINKKEIPSGMHVLHKCDNPSCVNPAHLFLGTHQDNMVDMAVKGRRSGEKNPRSKLSENSVYFIRKLHKKGGITQTAIAKTYGVTQATVSSVVRGKSWGYL